MALFIQMMVAMILEEFRLLEVALLLQNQNCAQVYPIVSAVWGHCEITMKYLGESDNFPPI